VEAEESQARVEAKNALDKAKTELTRKYKLHKLRKLLNTSPEEFLESMKNTLLSIETQFENALSIQDSKSAIQQLRQVKEGADSFEKMLQNTLKEIIPAELQTQDEKQNTQKQETKQRKTRGWNLDETIEKQLQSRGQLSALNRIPGSSLSPLSSQEVRSLNPKQLEKRLQDLVDFNKIDQKRKNKIMRTVRKFFEDRDLTHGQ
jgi:lipoate-protein ligase A